jgi:polysaccharide export outer membrane protein
MKASAFVASLAFACLAGSLVAVGQEQGDRGTSQTPPAVSSSAPSLDQMGIGNYLLGTGDELEVKFFQQPDLNTTATIDAQGLITLPFLDKPIQASCRTDKEVGKDVVAAYSKFFKSPQISVRVSGRFSRSPITVYGAVREPARVQALRKVRLSEIISFAGGVTDKNNGEIQVVHTENVMCPGPDDQVVDFSTFESAAKAMKVYKVNDIIAGKPGSNPVLRAGDVVTVMEAKPVYVTGNVGNPANLYLKPGMTLLTALAMVGGPRRDSAMEKISIWRQDETTGKSEVMAVDYPAIRNKKKPDIELKPYDIIDVPVEGPLGKRRIFETLVGAAFGGVSQTATYLPSRILY